MNTRFGEFGGQYIPEILMSEINHVAEAYETVCDEENKEKLHELAAFLLERETITGEEFMRLLNSEADVIETSATVVKEGEADAEEASSI